MRILLTGACGMIARAIRRVAASDHEFVLFDIAPQVVAEGGICASITDPDACARALEGCDAIIHTASLHGGFIGKASHAEFINTNLVGADNLCQAMIKHHIKRIVMSSTMEIYVGPDWRASGMTVLDESMPARPATIYPLTKLQVEQIGSFYSLTQGLEVVQLRYVNVVDKPPAELGMRLLARDTTAIDVARANIAGVTLPHLRDIAVNIGPDTPITQEDMFDAIDNPWEVLERHWPNSSECLKRAGHVPKLSHFWPVTRIDRAKSILNYRPESRFEVFLNVLGWKH